MKSAGKIFRYGRISAPCFSAHTVDLKSIYILLCGPQKGEPEVGDEGEKSPEAAAELGCRGCLRVSPRLCADSLCVLPLAPSQTSGSPLSCTMQAPRGRWGSPWL